MNALLQRLIARASEVLGLSDFQWGVFNRLSVKLWATCTAAVGTVVGVEIASASPDTLAQRPIEVLAAATAAFLIAMTALVNSWAKKRNRKEPVQRHEVPDYLKRYINDRVDLRIVDLQRPLSNRMDLVEAGFLKHSQEDATVHRTVIETSATMADLDGRVADLSARLESRLGRLETRIDELPRMIAVMIGSRGGT